MATPKEIAEIGEAIKSIPEKKERLRESLRVLKSYSSSATFTLEWEEIDDHLSPIEKSIHEQYDALGAKLLPLGNSRANISNNDQLSELNPRPELKSLCVRMDSEGLINFMAMIKYEDLHALTKELAPALRFAPDPAQLVVNAVEGFYLNSSSSKKVPCSQIPVKKSCINLLEKLQLIGPEIGPATREKASRLATEWKAMVCFGKGEVNNLGIIAFLQLIASYDLVANYDHDYILELFTNISRRKNAVVLVKNLGLSDNLSEVVQKLSSNRKHLDAVRIVYACGVVEKFPPVPLLRTCLKDSRRTVQEVLRKGKYSKGSQKDAAARHRKVLQLVLRAIEEYKLENKYPSNDLKKRLSQVDNEVADICYKRIQRNKANHLRQKSKRAKSAATPAIRPAGSYGLSASGSDYNHADQSLSGAAIGHSETRKSPVPYPYSSSDAFVGTGGMYERPVTYSGYPPRLPPPYGSS